MYKVIFQMGGEKNHQLDILGKKLFWKVIEQKLTPINWGDEMIQLHEAFFICYLFEWRVLIWIGGRFVFFYDGFHQGESPRNGRTEKKQWL